MSTREEKWIIRHKNYYHGDKIKNEPPFIPINPLLGLILISLSPIQLNPVYSRHLKEYQESEAMKVSWKKEKKEARLRHLQQKSDRKSQEDSYVSLQPVKKKTVKQEKPVKRHKIREEQEKPITCLNPNRFAILEDEN